MRGKERHVTESGSRGRIVDAPEAVAAVWRRYLWATQRARPGEYVAVEELSWRRLSDELSTLGRPLRTGH